MNDDIRPEQLATYLDLLRAGGKTLQAAESIGVDPSVLEEYGRINPDFAEQVMQARKRGKLCTFQKIEKALEKKAKQGKFQHIAFWLKTNGTARYRTKQQPQGRQGDEPGKAGGTAAEGAVRQPEQRRGEGTRRGEAGA